MPRKPFHWRKAMSTRYTGLHFTGTPISGVCFVAQWGNTKLRVWELANQIAETVGWMWGVEANDDLTIGCGRELTADAALKAAEDSIINA